jgi:hypothetical protein
MFCPSCGVQQPKAETCAHCGAAMVIKRRGLLFWLAVLGGATVVLCGGGYLVLLVGIINSEASEVAESFVRESADVQKFVGGEPSVAWFRDGKITTSRNSGRARFVLSATGPRGDCRVVVELVRAGDAWGVSAAGIVGADNRVSAISNQRKH